MTAKDHYANHLAQLYSWMVGSFDEKQRAQQDFFTSHDIKPGINKLAVDLGAGSGLQSISLANLGFNVIAVDFNKQLLDEVQNRSESKSVRIVQDDIISFLSGFNQTAQVMVCMGDTLTHLENTGDVERLIALMAKHLERGGKIVISFRELVTELKGEQRFIPVRSDDGRILTCFLEYFPRHVIVHDIVHELHEGTWIQRVSSYPKLRMSEQEVTAMLARNEIKVTVNQKLAGMTYIVGQKVT